MVPMLKWPTSVQLVFFLRAGLGCIGCIWGGKAVDVSCLVGLDLRGLRIKAAWPQDTHAGLRVHRQ